MKKKAKVVAIDDLIPQSKLDDWILHKRNVLFIGRHGVGKTAMIKAAFKRAGLRTLYLSGATLDPWIDFVGIPTKSRSEKTGKEVIKLIRPEYIEAKDPQAIFVDEYNRSHKKVRNAIMELCQFKTINGQKISSDLRVVWAAVNPDANESEYDVEQMDPAQQDRFHVQVEVPFKCSKDYFVNKFGEAGGRAVDYWNKLDDKIREKVSPRRLDYVMEHYKLSLDIRDCLPIEANPSKFLSILTGKGYMDLLKLLEGDPIDTENFFADETNYVTHIADVMSDKKYFPLLKSMPEEKISALLENPMYKRSVMLYIKSEFKQGEGLIFQAILQSIVDAGINKALVEWCKKMISLRLRALDKRSKKIVSRAKYKIKTTSYKSSGFGPPPKVPKVASGYNSKTVLLSVASKALSYAKKEFTIKDVAAEYIQQLNRHVGKQTIIKKVTSLTPFMYKKHKIKIKNTVLAGVWKVSK